MRTNKFILGGLILLLIGGAAGAVSLQITNTAKITNHKTPAENLTVPNANIEFYYGDKKLDYYDVNNPTVKQPVSISGGDVINGGNGLFKEAEAGLAGFDGKTIKARIWYPAQGENNYYFEFTYTFPATIMGPQAAWDWGKAKTIYSAIKPPVPTKISATQVLKGAALTLGFIDVTATPGAVEAGVSVSPPTYTFQISKNDLTFSNPILCDSSGTVVKSDDFLNVPAGFFAVDNAYSFRVKARNDYGEAANPWSPVFSVTPTSSTSKLELNLAFKPGINSFGMPFPAPWYIHSNKIENAFQLLQEVNSSGGIVTSFGLFDAAGQTVAGYTFNVISEKKTELESIKLAPGVGYQLFTNGEASVSIKNAP
jgi:hypothetical protein